MDFGGSRRSQVTDQGCAAVGSALRNGALPALCGLHLHGNNASVQAREAAEEELERRSAELARVHALRAAHLARHSAARVGSGSGRGGVSKD